MASVLAIISKALFDKLVPDDPELGMVIDTDRYVSANKTFDGLEAGDAIFLVTVRPPNEKLWLVGVLEKPKHKAGAWISAANTVPLTDVTAAIKKLKLASGTGLKAKKGKLGMSLQTPRALTAADDKLLRSMVPKASKKQPAAKKKKSSALDAYTSAVVAVVNKSKKTKKSSADLGTMRLENKRVPFEGKYTDLDAATKKQLLALSGDGVDLKEVFSRGDEEVAGFNSDMLDLEIADIVDVASGKVKYQLMLWPYGDGAIVKAGTTKTIAYISQHGLDAPDSLGKAWVADFAKAWYEGQPRLDLSPGHIDFDDDELGEDDDEDDDDDD